MKGMGVFRGAPAWHTSLCTRLVPTRNSGTIFEPVSLISERATSALLFAQSIRKNYALDAKKTTKKHACLTSIADQLQRPTITIRFVNLFIFRYVEDVYGLGGIGVWVEFEIRNSIGGWNVR